MPATSWSGFWGDGVGGSGAYVPLENNKLVMQDRVIFDLSRSRARKTTNLLQALLGVAVGGALPTVVFRREAVTTSDLGGLRTIEAVPVLSGVTTAAQLAQAQAATTAVNHRPTNYPRDLSGNGGKAFT